jgi:hypothetical protein
VDTKRFALLLIVLGLLLGPGYYVYCQHLSGKEVGRYELRERAERWTMPDGSVQRFSGHLAYQPVVLQLTPERNDVRLRLTFHAAGDTTAGRNSYLATLFDLDHPLVQRELDIDLKAGAATPATVATLPVHAPGEHVFILEELGRPAASISHVTLTVYQGAERLVATLAWAGTAMLLVGVALLAYLAMARARR